MSTVLIAMPEATKLTADRRMVEFLELEVGPRTSLNMAVEKSVMAWKPVSSLKTMIMIAVKLALACASAVSAYFSVTSDESPVFIVSI